MKNQGSKISPGIVTLITGRAAAQLLLRAEVRPVKGALCAARASSGTGGTAMWYQKNEFVRKQPRQTNQLTD